MYALSKIHLLITLLEHSVARFIQEDQVTLSVISQKQNVLPKTSHPHLQGSHSKDVTSCQTPIPLRTRIYGK